MRGAPGPAASFAREPGRRSARTQAEILRQLRWFAWLRLVVVTTATLTTLLLDFVRLDVAAGIQARPLYAVLAAAYGFAILSLGVLSLSRSAALVAAVQFGGDIVVETALLHVLGYEYGVAVALALFFLTTFLACSYLGRWQGALFVTGAFVLQVVVQACTWFGLLPEEPITGSAMVDHLAPREIVLNLSVFMFTFYATAWLVGSRAERLKAMGDRLQVVTDDLEHLQAFNEHVIRSMQSALVTTRLDDRITFANSAAEALIGQPTAALRGRPLPEVMGWDGPPPGQGSGEGGAPGPARCEREAVLSGRRRCLAVSVSRLEDREGGLLGLLYLMEDVTELRALEEEVRTKEKMAAIGELAAGIAHEIRNPLASISGSVQLLQRTLEIEGDQERLMGIVLRESRRLDQSIGEFLDFARPRALQPRQVDVAEIVRETVTLLGHSDEVRPGTRLVAPSGSCEARVDPDQVRQVAWNLCKNALRAMPSGGVLRADVRLAGAEVVLAVSDTGVGMSAATLHRAFEPLAGEFEQGMGLGLAIVYRIVKDHGGRVAIQSEQGSGTTVEVRLPVRPAEAAAREAS